MSASTSTAPATHAPLVAMPAVAAPFAPAADTVEHATTPPASVKSDVPIADSNASSAPRRGAPMRRTATYLDLRAWPGYAAAVGLPEPPRMPKSFYYSNHFTKTKWGSMDPIPMPKMEKKRVDQKAKVITGPVDWAKFKTMKGIKKQHAVTNGKVDETPLTKAEKKLAKRFRARYDLRRVKERVTRLKGAAKYAASVAAARALAASQAPLATPVSFVAAAPVAPVDTTTPAEVDPLMPGAFPDESDDAPAAAQTHLPTDDDSPSLTVALFRLAVEVIVVVTKRKRVVADDELQARDVKRRRVETNGPSQSRAVERPITGKPVRNTNTGAAAPTHNTLTATTGTSTARKPKKLKAALSKCPPPAPLVPVAGNKKESKAAAMQTSFDANKDGSALAHQPAAQPAASSSTVPAAATRAIPLSRQSTMVIDNASATSSTPSAAAAAQPNGTALLREAPTIIDFGLPSFSASAEGVNGLSRQPAVVFNFGATARSSSTSTPSFVPFTTTGFLPPLWALKQGSASSSNTTLASGSSSKTSRGSRGGARAHKFQEHKEAKRGREDKDDGAASA